MNHIRLREYDWLVSDKASRYTMDRLAQKSIQTIPEEAFELLRTVDHIHRPAFGDRRGKSRTLLSWNDQSAQARQWVGVLQAGDISIEVVPKVSNSGDEEDAIRGGKSALMGMLSYTKEMSTRFKGAALLQDDNAPLHEVFIRLFAQDLAAELRRGLPRGYVTREEQLTTVRGRPLVSTQIRQARGALTPMWCEHDEYLGDTPLARALLAACHVAKRRTRELRARRALRDCIRQLDGAAAVSLTSKALDSIVLDRQTLRFERAIQFCHMLLDDRSPSVRAGNTKGFAFAFDMNAVYESFVERFIALEVLPDLNRRLAPDGYEVVMGAQGGETTRYIFTREHAGTERLLLKPDLLFTLEKNGRALRKFVIDTKWKALEAKDGDPVSRADLYQMYAYMAEYDCRRVVLLYPGLDDSYTHDGYILNKDRDRRVLVKTMSVSEDPRNADVNHKLSAQLEEIIAMGLDLPP